MNQEVRGEEGVRSRVAYEKCAQNLGVVARCNFLAALFA